MTDLLSSWYVHDVTVERYTGSGAYGDTYAAPVTLTAFIDAPATQRPGQTLTAAGTTVDITQIAYLSVDTADIPPGSKVTLPATFGGRTAVVVAMARRDAAGLPVPEHLELALR